MDEIQENLNFVADQIKRSVIQDEPTEDHITSLLKSLKHNEIDFASILNITESFVKTSQRTSITLEQYEELFTVLQENYNNEFYKFNMPSLAVTAIIPVLKEELKCWNLLEEPVKPLPLFQKWKDILRTRKYSTTSLNPYHKLILDVWLPHVRSVTNTMECTKASAMADFITNWKPYLPEWILRDLVQDSILTRIQKDVDDWDPLRNNQDVHLWIRPWITFLGTDFETVVYATVRRKLGKALTDWYPYDNFAKLILKPWRDVFENGEIDAFLITNVVPKLQVAASKLPVELEENILDKWIWIIEWIEILPSYMMIQLLNKCFFPKWLSALNALFDDAPNYEQIIQLYIAWKRIIPRRFRSDVTVINNFRKALNIMSVGCDGPRIPEIVVPLPKVHNSAKNIEENSLLSQKISFKELVQQSCEKRGILWMPIPNRFIHGKQVYKCGKCQVYLDRNVLFVKESDEFNPVSLEELLNYA